MTGAKGLRNEVDATFDDAPAFDVLLIPCALPQKAMGYDPAPPYAAEV